MTSQARRYMKCISKIKEGVEKIGISNRSKREQELQRFLRKVRQAGQKRLQAKGTAQTKELNEVSKKPAEIKLKYLNKQWKGMPGWRVG